MNRITLEPLYGSEWVAALASLLIVACVILVTPPTQDPRQRRWLMMLRCIAGLVLLLTALRPTWVRTDNRPAAASLVIAVGQSKSMTLPDGDSGDRWATQQSVIDALANGLTDLDSELSIRLLAYEGQAEVLGEFDQADRFAEMSTAVAALDPSGASTRIGSAIQKAIDSAGGKALAAMVLIGDGTETLPTETEAETSVTDVAARRAAEVLNALGVPLWTVPTGPPGTNDSNRDVAILNLVDSYQLFAGNQFEVGFTVEANGLASTQLPVSVTWIDVDGNETVARTRRVDPRSARETIAVSVPMVAPEPGLYRLRVEAEAQEGEWVVSNNSQTSFVEVREGGGRVLILEGPGRPELTFLRRSLGGFPDLDIDYAPIRGDASWPIPLESVLSPGKYDIFVIGDLDSAAIGETQLQQLADRVASGSGLITLGGFHTYGIGGYADGPLASVLPIKLDASRRRQPTRMVLSPAELAARQAAQLSGPIRLVPTGKLEGIVNVGGQDLAEAWSELPRLSGANRFVSPKIAPGVQVVLESEDEAPLLVVGPFGRGRVASLAFDETYRWWRAGKKEVHQRFWRQLMLWLMSREETSGNSIVAEIDLRRFATNARPEFRARVQALTDPSSPVELLAKLERSDGEAIELEAVALSDPIALRGKLPELTPGFYELVVSASDESIAEDRVAFQVTETSRELSRPTADPVYLNQLANLTSKHGGASFDPARVDELIEVIRERRKSAETPIVEKSRLGEGPISGWIVFILFASSLSLDWYLRRRWGMA
ncbi:MAG: hypothetical protein AAGJ83_00510 [Planctomycetota bacterium]